MSHERQAKRTALDTLGRFLLTLLVVLASLYACFFVVATMGVIGHSEAPHQERARLDLGNLAAAARVFSAKYGRGPKSITELVTAGILEKMPRDPWDNPYRFWPTSDGGVFVSLGADHACGGSDGAADLVSEGAPSSWDPCKALER